MRGTIPPEQLLFDPEIEKRAKRNQRLAKERRQEESSSSYQEIEMADKNPPPPRTLGDYAIPTTDGCGSSIVRPPVQANNFEIKSAIVQLVQQN